MERIGGGFGEAGGFAGALRGLWPSRICVLCAGFGSDRGTKVIPPAFVALVALVDSLGLQPASEPASPAWNFSHFSAASSRVPRLHRWTCLDLDIVGLSAGLPAARRA